MSVNKILNTYIAYTYFTPYIYVVLHHKFAIYWDKSYDPTIGNKSVDTLDSKFNFQASWNNFPLSLPPPPQTMLIFLFFRQHRLQRLRNIELGAKRVSEN